jgi:hypothetical protein
MPPPAKPPSSQPRPPNGPPLSSKAGHRPRPPSATPATSGGAAGTGGSAPGGVGGAGSNPYGLSGEALAQKQRYDRERALANSSVRAVSQQPATGLHAPY